MIIAFGDFMLRNCNIFKEIIKVFPKSADMHVRNTKIRR